MKKILFCTDLSQSCTTLHNYISDWVKGTDIVVDVLHAYDPVIVNISSINVIDAPGFGEEIRDKMIGHMQTFIDELPLENRGQYHLVADKNTSMAMHALSDDINADLIVTGLREKYTLMDKLIGSTAAKLVQGTNKPLLVIPYKRAYSPIGKVLFPTESSSRNDLTEKEEEVLSWVYENLDKDVLPAIHLLHIAGDKEKTKTNTREKEDPFAKMMFTTTYSNDIVTGIIDHLESNPTNLIAINRTPKNLWDRIHKSSVAKNLLYKSKMPILFV